ncbi:hypothetical protein GCM10009117_00220 [Gangjinia marincola]|uniref:Deacylase n=1 Tax=Gangjinia marincola TaxID=578463 RepID=A0ABN1MCR7_9FLAO
MRAFLIACLFMICSIQAQERSQTQLVPEALFGILSEPNEGFPATSLQTGFVLSYAKQHKDAGARWMEVLGRPTTGISIGISDFGNQDAIGQGYFVLPFIELKLNKGAEYKWTLHTGFGASYFPNTYDPETNALNRGISTHLNWSYRAFVYRYIHQWKIGLGYFHHSNGHSRIPNQGFNSFLFSVSRPIALRTKTDPAMDTKTTSAASTVRTKNYFYTVRAGLGVNTFGELRFKDKKEVYAFAADYGFIVNKTFMVSIGAYYRFYQHYYDVIQSDEPIITERYAYFKENAFSYASNYGIAAKAGIVLGHIGADLQLGVNIHKPFYKVDWELNEAEEGIYGTPYYKPGKLDAYYELKRSIMSRLGLTYYLFNTDKLPKTNVFIGAHLNANFGQAEFSEVSVGVMRRLD